ncbi:hypothetical protein LIER_22319 [Lithospermum erythrorhizon]|uniref:Uncharacterized protein n=1 Tax=Lithospermum erythrorhizon TaxID=34254 RepID=A0AAV3QTG5_LITER
MGPKVPISWTTHGEESSLFVRDTAFIKSQVYVLRHAIPMKPNWTPYCEESALIMAGLVYDKMLTINVLTPSLSISAKVWEDVPNAADPIQVEVAAMKGRLFTPFSSQLVVRKSLIPGSEPVPVFQAKRSSTSEVPASASKRAKVEALQRINAPNLTPNTSPIKVISLDDELTVSAQERDGVKKKKYVIPPVFGRSSKAIIPLLAKSRASSKKGKGKGVSSQGEESSLDCYTSSHMKAPYTLPKIYVSRRSISGTTAVNAQYAAARREEMKDISSEQMQAELESIQVTLKEREEEVSSTKDALSAKQ